MRVLFVDVGQGTCQIVLTGQRRAIVIDAGSSPGSAIRILRLLRIETIELLILSHSHIDHSGGLATKRRRLQDEAVSGILVDYRGAIGRIAYVFDSDFRLRPVGQYLVKMVREGHLKKEQLLHFVASEKPYPLWISDNKVTRIAALSPLGGDHLLAFESQNPNASSAILELRHLSQKIIFAADSEFEQWREVYRLRGEKPLVCKALTMPHHGGLMKGTAEDLRWFCEDAVDSEIVVVSVGTINQHKHPREEVIRAMSLSGCEIVCTQITEKCCNKLESVRPGVIGPPRFPGKSSIHTDLTRSGKRSRNVACAGTVSALLDDKGIVIERKDEHRIGVDQLVKVGHSPLCRPSPKTT